MSLVLPPLLLGLFVFRMPFDEVAGIVAGCLRESRDPCLLEQAGADRRDRSQLCDVFPGMTIVKILLVTIVPAFIS